MKIKEYFRIGKRHKTYFVPFFRAAIPHYCPDQLYIYLSPTEVNLSSIIVIAKRKSWEYSNFFFLDRERERDIFLRMFFFSFLVQNCFSVVFFLQKTLVHPSNLYLSFFLFHVFRKLRTMFFFLFLLYILKYKHCSLHYFWLWLI